MIDKSLRDRFFKNKFTYGEECWLWFRARTKAGYGLIYVKKGIAKYAHRVSYEIHHGPIPIGIDICHTCDNPACVKPSHLFLGTAKDNALDMVKKGRARNKTHIGSKNGNTRLTEQMVLEIRLLMDRGVSGCEVGRQFGINQTTASAIKRRITWRHI